MEAVKRWFVHDWQTLDNKIKSSIVEGVSVFLAMFDMPDVAKVFCPAAPHISDDPQAIILQAQLKRLKAEKDAAAEQAEPSQRTKAERSQKPQNPRRRRKQAGGGATAAGEADPEPLKAARRGW